MNLTKVKKDIKKSISKGTKDYLNSEEMNDFMLIGLMLDTTANAINSSFDSLKDKKINKIRIAWDTRNNLTTEEHKALKTAETYLTKFYTSVLSRLGQDEIAKIRKKTSNYNIRVIDKFTLDKLNRDTNNKTVNAVVPRGEFEDWCEEIMEVNCKNCSKDRKNCKLKKVFDDNFVPESDWGLDNCKYAYENFIVDGATMPRRLERQGRKSM